MQKHNAIQLDNQSVWVIWRFVDGKPGHENQSQGLIDALAQRVALKVYDLQSLSKLKLLKGFVDKKVYTRLAANKPDLCLGAGHKTHLSILASGFCFGAKTVVLMKPSLPVRCFDLCLIPEHDKVFNKKNCIVTQGVLNRVRFHLDREANQNLILLGGISRHYIWDNQRIVMQLHHILHNQPGHWTIATSRRTPDSLLPQLEKLKSSAEPGSVTIVTHDAVDRHWLPMMLNKVGNIWVSVDSVSMVYESLSSGAACGLLTLESAGTSRVTKGLENLVSKNQITTYERWRDGQALTVPSPAFSEAARCAEEIISRFGIMHERT